MDEEKPLTKWLLVFPFFSFMLLGAHFMRQGDRGLFLVSSVSSLLIFVPLPYIRAVLATGLLAGVPVWAATGMGIAGARMSSGQPYGKAVLIIGAVALFTGASSYLLFRMAGFSSRKENWLAVAVFFLSLSLLAVALSRNPKLILLERFFHGGGALQIFLAALFGSFVSTRLWDTGIHAKWRLRFWLAFSVFFYLQLLLGVFGEEIFLLTGKLHIPVPAMVIAGPIYRGEGFFMPILFLLTILLVGPAWCSHLCYFGAWDNLASTSNNKRPENKPRSFGWIRAGSLVLTAASAWLFKAAGVPAAAAAALGIAFGAVSVASMVAFSKRYGLMVNCTAVCPLGLAANILGKVSPFRLKIDPTCVDCMACFRVCRYGALLKEDIERRKAGFSCSLCGDCVISCPRSSIRYSFLGLKPEAARFVFVLLSSTLYAAFFAVAMV